ncbi:hypothetical protein ACWGOQ_0013365 [Aquimarina sp. M1]
MEEKYKDIEKLVKEAGIEKPPLHFLQNIMSEIAAVSADKLPMYQPLISKKAWVIISISVVFVLISLPFLSEGTSILDTLNFSILSLDHFQNPFSDFKFHDTTMYGIIFLAVLFLVQITIIKRRIDKIYAV